MSSNQRVRFSTLPGTVQQRILDAHRETNVQHDWWDFVYEGFKRDMAAIGIRVDRMGFSGFWSQGDGAWFEGRINDYAKFLPTLGYTASPLIELADNHWWFESKYGRYNSATYSCDLPLPDDADDQLFANSYLPHEQYSLQETVALVLLAQFNSSAMEERMTEAFNNHMHDLYSRLEEEYEHLTSDEAILDSLEANDQIEDAINSSIMEAQDA